MRISEKIRNGSFWLMLILALVTTIMSVTGRYDILPHPDLVWDAINAHELCTSGQMPLHGTASSLNALNPPGVAFGFAPGMLLFPHHPVAAERFGASLMFAGCLLGLYLWLDKRLGHLSTSLIMLLFTVGSAGAFFQTNLWPRAHPLFYIWFLFAISLWIERRKGLYLGAALVIFAMGMYWFMEIAPAIFLIPVIYYLYHPPLGIKPIVTAIIISLAIWSPYLAFESSRGFIDIKSLLTLKPPYTNLTIENSVSDKRNHLVNAWDIPQLKKKAAEGKKMEIPGGSWQTTKDWGTVWTEGEPRSFLGEWGLVFYTEKVGGWGFQSMETARVIRQGENKWDDGSYTFSFKTPYTVQPVSGQSLLKKRLQFFSPFYNFGGDQNFYIWLWQLLLFLASTTYLAVKCRLWERVKSGTRYWWGFFSRSKRNTSETMQPSLERNTTWTVLIAGAIIPTLITTLLVPCSIIGNMERRFLWLWIAEAAVIGAALGTWKPRGKPVGALAGIIAIVTFAANPLTLAQIANTFRGWPNHHLMPVEQTLSKLASIIKSEGRDSAAIGYDVNINEWRPELRKIDGISKCAMEWDLALLLAHGIHNLDTTPEGISDDDEFRIVATDYDISPTAHFHQRWSTTADIMTTPMQTIAETPGYVIMRKVSQTQSKKH